MIPENLKYTERHHWCVLEKDIATIGVTEHALEALGSLVLVDLPEYDSDVLAEVPYGELEGIDDVMDLWSPFDGVVAETNEEAVHNPELLASEPHERGWLIRLKLLRPEAGEHLLSLAEYEQLIKRRKR